MRPALITAKLDRTHAQPDDVIRMTELVPRGKGIRVRGFHHTVYVVGQYDLALNALVNRDPEKPLYSDGKLVFDKWRGSLRGLCEGYFQFEVSNAREEGRMLQFKARQLGIYWIKAEWTLYPSEEVIESNPVVLTVSPPGGKDGKPIIKEEWIDPIAWKYRPQK